MISILLVAFFSVSPLNVSDRVEAENLCIEIVATLEEYAEYTELTDEQVRAIAGRCYSVYVEAEERRSEEEQE